MRINIRRGLFRLWIAAAALWVVLVAALSVDDVRKQFALASRADLNWRVIAVAAGLAPPEGAVPLVPVVYSAARGTPETDFSSSDGLCWYKILTFRKLYSEYNDLSDTELEAKLYEHVGRPLPQIRPWRTVAERVGLALGPPVGLLVLGWALIWAVAGFQNAGNHAL